MWPRSSFVEPLSAQILWVWHLLINSIWGTKTSGFACQRRRPRRVTLVGETMTECLVAARALPRGQGSSVSIRKPNSIITPRSKGPHYSKVSTALNEPWLQNFECSIWIGLCDYSQWEGPMRNVNLLLSYVFHFVSMPQALSSEHNTDIVHTGHQSGPGERRRREYKTYLALERSGTRLAEYHL